MRFTRFRKEGVDCPLENGFHCWVGINTALEKDYVEINPFVGAHVVPVEKLWKSLKGGKYLGKYNRGYATYALHMGHLVSDEPVIRFSQPMDVDAEAARVARLYSTIGLTYARSTAAYERLLPLLQERIEMLGAYPERVACCLYLMGRKEEARAYVEGFLPKKRDYSEGFAVPLLKILSEEDQYRECQCVLEGLNRERCNRQGSLSK